MIEENEKMLLGLYDYALALVRKRVSCMPTAKDIVQDSMIAAWQKLKTVSVRVTENYMKLWLARILLNKVIDWKRRCDNRFKYQLSEVHELNTSPQTRPLYDDMPGHLHQAISKLNPGAQKAFQLRLQGFKLKEIAVEVKKPHATVRTIMHRGYSQIGRIMQEKWDYPAARQA